MGKSLYSLSILVVLVFLVGCMNANENLDLPATSTITKTKESTPTLTSTPVPRTATITATRTKKPSPTTRPTKTLTPTTTPTKISFPQWNSEIKVFRFDGEFGGIWAKTSNAFLFESTIADNPTSLIKVTAPEFLPVTLLSIPPGISFENFYWSPDNQLILYTCYSQDGGPRLCMVGADGNNPRVINPNFIADYFAPEEWLDPQKILFTDYAGGGYIGIGAINIITGERYPWGAVIHGRVYPPNNKYIPATSDTGEFDFKLMAIADKYPYRKLDVDDPPSPPYGNFIYLPEYRSIPRAQTISIFDAWLPNSNVMLVFWGHFKPFDDNPVNGEPQGHDLLLWDVDKNKVRLIAPGGRGGIFSPDGKLLAYLTSGPAKLDIHSKPLGEELTPTEPVIDYMQLLDMSTGKVQMSIPVIAHQDNDDLVIQAHGFLEAQFSPDSHYLAFYTPGKVMKDASGWPTEVSNKDGTNIELNLLDLQEKRIVWSIPSAVEEYMSWSPASNFLVYRDQQLNWQLLNLEEYQTTPITLSNGKDAGYPEWSYDGTYLSFQSQRPFGDEEGRSTISIFDLSQMK